MEIILLLLYTSVFFILLRIILVKIKNGWAIEPFFLSLINLFYVFIPITMIIYKYLIVEQYIIPDLKVILNNYEFYNYMTFSVTIIFLSSFFLGCSLIRKTTKDIYIKRRIVSISNFKINILLAVGYFFSILSFLAIVLYVKQLGGLERAILYANLVRSGYGEEVFISSTYVFVKRFISFSLFSIFIYIIIENKKNFMNIIFLLLIPLVILLISKLLLFSSKQGIIGLLLLIIFYLSIKHRKSYMILLITFIMSLLLLLPLVDELLLMKSDYYIEKEVTFNFITFTGYFSFPQVSLAFALQENYDFIGITDFILGLKGNFIPMSMLLEYTSGSNELNTKFFYGFEKAIVPPGIIAFSYYSFGIFGIITIGFLTGLVVRKIDLIFSKYVAVNSEFIILYAYIIGFTYTYVRTGLPRFSIYHPMTVSFILMILVSYKIYQGVKYDEKK